MQDKIIITGSLGLLGSACTNLAMGKGYKVIGIDNNARQYYFGKDGSVDSILYTLNHKPEYEHHEINITDQRKLEGLFWFHRDAKAIIHTAAQPSHDWAAKNVLEDFRVNTEGTLNVLESAKMFLNDKPIIHVSTSKVYGDWINYAGMSELDTRCERIGDKNWRTGQVEKYINEHAPVDHTLHSFFGCSKLAADIYAQEYQRNFGLKVYIFRPGCITGALHQGVEMHGFLNYLVKCLMTGKHYTIFGYKGKQVRDNIHANDLAKAFFECIERPKNDGDLYNIGGGEENNCSILEAIEIAERLSGKKLHYQISEQPRTGDHIWWVNDTSRFKLHYPNWKQEYTIESMIQEMVDRWV